MSDRAVRTFLLSALLAASLAPAEAQTIPAVTPDAPARRPAAIINLASDEGVRLVQGQWRYSDTKIIEVDHRGPGPDLRPSGAPNRTYNLTPLAGAADFDDSQWQAIPPSGLEARRGNGRLWFNWYRIKVTLPEKVGGFHVAGATVVFELVVDDYAEVWVNGRLSPFTLGQTGGPGVKGFNAPNRVVLSNHARPGEQFQIAVLGANGPLSNPPVNFIWIRSATLDFFKPGDAGNVQPVKLDVERKDPALDAIVPANAALERVATGFYFTEGPVWHPDGYLLFSDPNANTIYRWSPEGQVSVFRAKSGYAGLDIGEYNQPGSNGLTLDKDGLLTIDEHGNRRVVRQERTGFITVLADRYEGKRLNSPNDLVYRSDGALCFTDPYFGLPKFDKDPRKELPFSGVFCVINGKLSLVTRELDGPNGIAFSPDEKYLYVGNWDPKKKVVMRYELNADGTAARGTVFFDMTSAPGEDAVDGVKVDRSGNVYVSGPGGLWILSPEGKHLGTLRGPEHAHNMAWGDADGRTLYWAAQSSIYRVRLNIPGVRPPASR